MLSLWGIRALAHFQGRDGRWHTQVRSSKHIFEAEVVLFNQVVDVLLSFTLCWTSSDLQPCVYTWVCHVPCAAQISQPSSLPLRPSVELQDRTDGPAFLHDSWPTQEVGDPK